MGALVQIVGALLILAAFGLGQAGLLSQAALSYVVLNLVGASILAADAYFEQQWGFLLLEGVWALIAAWSLARLARKPAEASTAGPVDVPRSRTELKRRGL
jgi:hypothetical protein